MKVKSQKSLRRQSGYGASVTKVKTVIILFLLVFLLLATGYWLFANRYSLIANRRWDGQSRFTVVEIARSVSILSFDPQTASGVEITLPDNLEIAAVAGRGRLLASSLVAAGNRDWAAASVGQTLGILLGGEKSQLNWIDKLLFWWGGRNVQWQKLDLVRLGLVEPYTTADRVEVLRLAPTWDQQAPEVFSSLAVAQEQLSLKIVNTTRMAGLAAAAARGIESSGIKVVEVSTTPDQPLERCLVASSKSLRKTVGVSLLLKSFDCDWQEGDELVLYLGRKYQEFVVGGSY